MLRRRSGSSWKNRSTSRFVSLAPLPLFLRLRFSTPPLLVVLLLLLLLLLLALLIWSQIRRDGPAPAADSADSNDDEHETVDATALGDAISVGLPGLLLLMLLLLLLGIFVLS